MKKYILGITASVLLSSFTFGKDYRNDKVQPFEKEMISKNYKSDKKVVKYTEEMQYIDDTRTLCVMTVKSYLNGTLMQTSFFTQYADNDAGCQSFFNWLKERAAFLSS